MGLSQNLASLWKNPSTGNGYVLSDILKNETIRTKNTRVVNTPNLVQALQDHFDCDQISGLQLENDDNIETTNNLEVTVFLGEIMSSAITTSASVISPITAAWLKDIGWYSEVNQEMITELEYGKSK
jgi:hypothetical protein